MNKHNFCEIEWGPDEAKGDKNLPTYFFEFPDFHEIKNGNCRYVIGRKGTGKTAVIEAVKNQLSCDPLHFSSSLSLRDFPLSIVRKLRDRSCNDKSQFVPVWKFLIIMEICKLISQDEGAQPIDSVDYLRRTLINNFGSIDFTMAETLTYLSEKKSKLSFSLPPFGLEHNEGIGKNITGELHYQKAGSHILKILKSIKSDSTYYLFIDELDEGFKAGDDNLRLLILSLLRATEDSFIDFNDTNITFRPILALRNDIFDRLEDNDINKLDDYIVRLNWISAKNGPMSLYKVADKRIEASFGSDSIAWDDVVNDKSPGLPLGVDSLWKYITNRTFERPRDIVKFLKFCKKESHSGVLTFKEVSAAEDKFSNWFYQEFQNEAHSYLPVWRNAMQVLTSIGQWHFTYDEIKAKLLLDEEIVTFLRNDGSSVDKVISFLFDFSVIGNVDSNRRWLFKYKDHDLSWDKNMNMIVHFGFAKKLRLKKVNNNGVFKSNQL